MNIAILPIKFDSKRIPMKMIKNFCGIPLWSIVASQVKLCPMIDKVYFSCSDESFVKLINDCYLVKRPKTLDGDVELTEVIKHAARQVAKSGDTILQIQLNKPLTKTADIMQCIQTFNNGKYDSLSTVQEIGTGLIDEYVKTSRNGNKHFRSQAICKIWKYETLMNSKQPYAYSKSNHYYMPIAKHHIEIDDMEDWKIAEALYKAGF